jgi:hypothetical protein
MNVLPCGAPQAIDWRVPFFVEMWLDIALLAFLWIVFSFQIHATWFLHAMILNTVIFKFVETIALKEHRCFSADRISTELLWRLLLGLCTNPIIASVGNFVYSGALCFVYTSSFPSLVWPLNSFGCTTIWTVESGLQIKESLSQMESLKDDLGLRPLF